MKKTIEIPEGYEARIEGSKVILEQNDESIRNFLYEFIKICGWSEKNFPPRGRCLAYLEKQKSDGGSSEKPNNHAEWSGEEKMHLANAILAAEKEWGIDSCTANFLKSLRPQPHWKPSEEDFAELTRLRDSMPNNEWGNQAEGVLDELIDNLKKL